MTEVVAAIIHRNGKILIARRNSGRLCGKWEFPGGKVEDGENPKEALSREIREEFGVDCEVQHFIDQSSFTIDNQPFRLSAFTVVLGGSRIFLKDHDQIEWVQPEKLRTFDLAEPDIPIAERLAARAIDQTQKG